MRQVKYEKTMIVDLFALNPGAITTPSCGDICVIYSHVDTAIIICSQQTRTDGICLTEVIHITIGRVIVLVLIKLPVGSGIFGILTVMKLKLSANTPAV